MTESTGVVIGLIGDDDAGMAGVLAAHGGRFLDPGHDLDLSPAPVICIAYGLDLRDAATRLIAESRMESLRRSGSRILLASHDTSLLRRVADEVWWIEGGGIKLKGDPGEVLPAYERHALDRARGALADVSSELAPAMRRGDGRAELLSIQTPGSWQSGEESSIVVTVRFHAPVQDPVVGIMIRTRIGMEVYGTNTELERVQVGPCREGDVRTVAFRIICNLCPQYYTITAASHDPDGVWHDWMEDAVAFVVTDTRYTAGVANLRARVELTDPRE